MKAIKKADTISFTNSPTCAGFAFDFGDKDLDIAVVTVNGRYPEKGQLINEKCKEIAYVLSGNGKVGVNGKVQQLSSGDAILILPGEKFFWEGNQMEMLMPCSPAFYIEQHKEVD